MRCNNAVGVAGEIMDRTDGNVLRPLDFVITVRDKAIWRAFVAPHRGVLTPICSGGVRMDHDTRGARLYIQAASYA